jgi:hypothetical protein
MAVTHVLAARNGMADLVVDLLDGGGTGTLEFQTAGSVEVATLTLANPAFAAAAGGSTAANAIASDTSATGGTTTKAVFKSGSATATILCSVTTSGGGGDIELSAVGISAGQTVAVTSVIYTAPL